MSMMPTLISRVDSSISVIFTGFKLNDSLIGRDITVIGNIPDRFNKTEELMLQVFEKSQAWTPLFALDNEGTIELRLRHYSYEKDPYLL